MKPEPDSNDFNPYDTMLRIAQQGHSNSKQLVDTAETLERLVRIVHMQSDRIDSLESRLLLLETRGLEETFDQLLTEYTKKG